MAQEKLVTRVERIRDIHIGAKVEKRRGLDPQVLLEVKFTIPAGDITQLGPLVNLESEKQKVSVLFFAEETQPRMDLEPLSHFSYEVTEKDATQDEGSSREVVATFSDGKGKTWTGKGFTPRPATIATWEQMELKPGELPSFLTAEEEHQVRDILEGTSEKAFAEMESAGTLDAVKDALERATKEKEQAAAATPEVVKPKRGRPPKKTETPGDDGHSSEGITTIRSAVQAGKPSPAISTGELNAYLEDRS